MTVDDLLQVLLIASDDSDRVFRHRDLAEWPEGGLELFTQLGLLRRESGGLMAECDTCTEPHLESVVVIEGADGLSRMFIHCPEAMRVEVEPEMCECWEVDPDGFARSIATTLDLKTTPKAILSNRLWRLGRMPYGGKTRKVLLAMGLHLPDAGAIARHIGPKGRSIVLVPSIVPDDQVWPDVVPAVIALDQIASMEKGALLIDGKAFMDMVAEADEDKDRKSILPVDPDIKKEIVGRMVTRAIDRRELDELCIRARKSTTSYRGAAEMLTKKLGRPISKDRVSRAFEREGGFDSVMASPPKKGVS